MLGGGRYDDLLGRYGRPSPAVGFAVDVEVAAAALEAACSGLLDGARRNGHPATVSNGVQTARRGNGAARKRRRLGRRSGGGAGAGGAALGRRAARGGKRVAVDLVGLSGDALGAYARRWGFSEIIRLKKPVGDSAAPRVSEANRPCG